MNSPENRRPLPRDIRKELAGQVALWKLKKNDPIITEQTDALLRKAVTEKAQMLIATHTMPVRYFILSTDERENRRDGNLFIVYDPENNITYRYQAFDDTDPAEAPQDISFEPGVYSEYGLKFYDFLEGQIENVVERNKYGNTRYSNRYRNQE